MFGLSSFSSKKSAEEVSGESRVLVNTLDWRGLCRLSSGRMYFCSVVPTVSTRWRKRAVTRCTKPQIKTTVQRVKSNSKWNSKT